MLRLQLLLLKHTFKMLGLGAILVAHLLLQFRCSNPAITFKYDFFIGMELGKGVR
jgi:hypothetical protein